MTEQNRVLIDGDPEQLAEALKDHLYLIRGEKFPGLIWDAVFGLRELADLRAKVKALEPYLQNAHAEECAMVSVIIGDGGVVVHEAKPCNCGLAELLGDSRKES